MKIIQQLLLTASFVVAPSLVLADNHELAREPHGIDSPVPEAAQPPASPSKKITIYTAKSIVTLDPGTPSAEAVAVMDGKILGVGTLDEVKGWVTDEAVEIDSRFEDAVIIPGLIEAHMRAVAVGDRIEVGARPRPAQGRGCQTAERW